MEYYSARERVIYGHTLGPDELSKNMLRRRSWTQETMYYMVCLYDVSRKAKLQTERLVVSWGRDRN